MLEKPLQRHQPLIKIHVSAWDQARLPSFSFHVLEKQRGRKESGMEEGRTSEIATFFLSPRTRPGFQHEATQATRSQQRENRQTLDQSIQIALLVIFCWLTLRGIVL